MTKIAIPPDLAAMFAACEDAYEQATREGYAENPAVIAAVTALKSAWKTLHLENYKRMTAKGFFSVEFAAMRADRACQATREACGNRAGSAGTSSVRSVLETEQSTGRLTAAGSSARG